MDCTMLLHAKSTISLCPPSIQLPRNECGSIANCYTDREMSIISTYLNNNAQTALGQFVVNILYHQFCNKKHLQNVGPIRHCEPPHAACSNFTLPFTRCRYCRTPPLSHSTCASMSKTTTMTTRDRGDRYGPIEWAQQIHGQLELMWLRP